jgi:hypothetical protein
LLAAIARLGLGLRIRQSGMFPTHRRPAGGKRQQAGQSEKGAQRVHRTGNGYFGESIPNHPNLDDSCNFRIL